jgi:adenylate kinase family enzyme
MIGKRIVVVGTTGSGKSTFAQQVSDVMKIKRVELDAINWQPNWTPLPNEEFAARLLKIITSHESWVSDGNYSAVRTTLWSHADTIVWLDYPKWLVMKRILSRTIQRGVTQQELWGGNRESLKNMLSTGNENIVLWSWRTYEKNRERYSKLMTDSEYQNLQWIRLQHPKDAEAFIERLKQQYGAY